MYISTYPYTSNNINKQKTPIKRERILNLYCLFQHALYINSVHSYSAADFLYMKDYCSQNTSPSLDTTQDEDDDGDD